MNVVQFSQIASPSVLLVDSDSENRMILKVVLLLKGYEVHEADSFDETIEKLATHKVAAVIIDLELSKAQRHELVSRLQSDEFGKVALFLLVASSVMSREDAYDLGAVAALSKPVDPTLLITRLEAALVPSAVRWKTAQNKHPRHQVAVSLNKISLGRGGFTLNNEPDHQIFEGETVGFSVEVDDLHPWRLNGTGIVRYVKLDQKNRRQKAWGVEFESLDESSYGHVVHAIQNKNPASYIPRCS